MSSTRTLALCFLIGAGAGTAQAQRAQIKADFLILLDRSVSLKPSHKKIRDGLATFLNKINQPSQNIDGRVAVVLFGGSPVIALPFTSAKNVSAVRAAIDGANYTRNLPEAGLETIRMALDDPSLGTRFTPQQRQGLAFRGDALRNVILLTDEDSDAAVSANNRMNQQDGPKSQNGTVEPPFTAPHRQRYGWAPWQAEIDQTAKILVDRGAFLNIVLRRLDKLRRNESPLRQYGDPAATRFNNGRFDRGATLAALGQGPNDKSLQARVLQRSKPSATEPPLLVARAFDIQSPTWATDLFNAKFDETTCPCPSKASVTAYGASSGGVGKLPRLGVNGTPKVCSRYRLELVRGKTANAAACILFSTKGLSTPAQKWWGLAHLDTTAGFEAGVILAGLTTGWTIGVPCNDLAACGRALYVQGVFVDRGRPSGIAYTNGVKIVVGS